MGNSNCGETTRNGVIGTVQRAMNWAVKQGIIDRSPVFGIEKPPRNRREASITPEQYDEVLEIRTRRPLGLRAVAYPVPAVRLRENNQRQIAGLR